MDNGSRAGKDDRAEWYERLERVCLSNLLAHSPDAIYFKDVDSRFVLVSQGVVEHHRLREAQRGQAGRADIGPADFIGKSDLDLFERALALDWIAEERRIVETGEPVVDVLERDTSSDGAGGWFVTNKAALRDEDGSVIGTFGVSRDVTAQVTAERELARRQAQLQAVLDSSHDAIISYNRALRHEMVNTQTAELLGAPAEEIVGRTDAELGLPPAFVADLQGALTRVFDTGRMCEFDFGAERDGSPRWWHIRIVPQVDPTGEVTGAVAAARDLSELKAAQGVLEQKALHDGLTGLPNRVAVIDRLSRALDG
ncbi:MAG TPA: PAS domain-containing protein, partial [Acidimicrobiales bacterium]|nr:PAS domain-containing protein [Acidimicrobiales bacterium]